MRTGFIVIARRPKADEAISKTGLLRFARNDMIVTIIFLLVSSCCFAQVGQEEADFAFAKKAFSDGFYALAQDNLEDFLEKYPSTNRLYEAHLLLGRCFYYENNLKKSSYEFDIVLASPDPAEYKDSALYWQGDICYRSGDYKKALELYQRVIDEYPGSRYAGYAAYSKACSYYRLGFFDNAASVFGEVASRYPFEKIAMESQFKIGECEYLMGRYDEAAERLKLFIEKYPLSEKMAESYYLMGELDLKKARYADSINSFNRALSISPKARWSAFALYRLAEAYYRTKDYNESMKAFQACAGETKSDYLKSNCLVGLIRNYEKKGMAQEALKLCDEVTSRFAKTDAAAEGYYLKAVILNGERRSGEARDLCLKALDKFVHQSQTGKLHYELGWAYLKENAKKEALPEFISAVRYLKDEDLISSALCKIGDIHLSGGNIDKAMESYDAVLKSYAQNAWTDYAQYQVGNIFTETGRCDQAILAYQSVLVNFPGTGLKEKAVFGLAAAYFNKGEFEHAYEELERLTKISAQAAGNAVYKFYLANSLYNMNRYDEALEIYRALSKDSSQAEIAMMSQYQTGWCYYRMNKDMEAADSFEAFLKRYPDSGLSADALSQSSSILLNAAQNFEKWKMPDDAGRLYKRLENLNRR